MDTVQFYLILGFQHVTDLNGLETLVVGYFIYPGTQSIVNRELLCGL